MKRILSLWLIFSFVLPALAEKKTLTVQELKSLLIEPIPGFEGVEEFFKQYQNEPPSALNELNQDVDFNILREKGRLGREAYLGLIRSYFSSNEAFIFNPEAAAVEFIRNVIRAQKDRPAQKPLKEIEVRNMAYHQTLTRYGFPQSLSWSQFDRLVREDRQAQLAMDYYRRVYFQLSSKEFETQNPELPQVQEVRGQIRKRLQSLRLLNFKNQLDAFLKLRPQPARVAILDGENRRSYMGLAQLMAGRIEFAASNEKTTHTVQIEASAGLSQQQNQKAPKLDQLDAAAEFYQIPDYYPSDMNKKIQIKLEDGRSIVLSEQDWLKIFNQLRDGISVDEDPLRAASRRFLIEGPARDHELAQLDISFDEYRDPNLEYLLSRLQERSQHMSRKIQGGVSSLTHGLRNLTTRQGATPLADFFWAGFLANPNYWRLRDEVASNLQRPLWYSSSSKSPTLSPGKIKALEKEYSVLAQSRLLPLTAKADKAKRGKWLKRLISIGAVATLVAGINMKYGDWYYDLNAYHDPDELSGVSSSNSTIDDMMKWVKDRFFDALNMDPPAGSGASYEDPNSDYEIRNDAFSSRLSDDIRIVQLQTGVPMPSQFNLARRDNFPTKILNTPLLDGDYVQDDYDFRNPDLVTQVQNIYYDADKDDLPDFDLVVESKLRTELVNGRLPIVSFDRNYKLVGLTVYERGKYFRTYQIYQLPRSGLYYIKADTKKKTGFTELTYRAIYKYAPDLPSPVILSNLQVRYAAPLNQELLTDGFTNLATNLIAQTKDQLVLPMHRFINNFGNSMTYVNENGPKLTFRPDMDISEMKIFVKNGEVEMQCNGGNAILRLYLRDYFKAYATARHKSVDQFNIEPLYSYPVDFATGNSKKPGHVRTLLNYYNLVSHDWSTPLIVDGTPKNMKQYPPVKVEAPRDAIRPENLKLVKGSAQPESENEVESVQGSVQQGLKISDPDSDAEFVRKQFSELLRLKKDHLRLFEDLEQSNPFIKNTLLRVQSSRLEPENIWGLAPIRIISLLDNYLTGKLNLEDTLTEMHIAAHKWPSSLQYRKSVEPNFRPQAQALIVEFGNESLAQFAQNYLNAFLEQTNSTRAASYNRRVDPQSLEHKVYILSDELQFQMSQILQILRDTPWHKGLEAQAKTCEDGLVKAQEAAQ